MSLKIPIWLDKIHLDGKTDAIIGVENIEQPEKCSGSGGQRRLVGILSSCVYTWVLERSLEWHADLTHAELLMDEDFLFDNQSKATSTVVQSKKSKKKKKKRSSKKETSADTTSQEKKEETPKISTELQEEEASSDEEETNNSSNLNNKEESKNDQPQNDFDQPELEEDNEDEDQYEESFVNIIVYGKKSQTTVDNYLCDRFLQILEDEEFVVI